MGTTTFSETLKIINTCGWDTDCNSGNLACLMGIKEGLAGIDAGRVARAGLARPHCRSYLRAYCRPQLGHFRLRTGDSTNCECGVSLGRRYRRGVPKNGAQFHFEMPGSLQGFTVTDGEGVITNQLGLSQAGQHALRLQVYETARFGTPTFAPSADFAAWTEQSWNPYPLIASPRVYPGQILNATLLQWRWRQRPSLCGLLRCQR